MSSIEPTTQLKIETLQALLLVGRLPDDARLRASVASVGTPLDIAAAACLVFSGMGVHWPIPCLARKMDGGWFTVSGAGPGDDSEWRQ